MSGHEDRTGVAADLAAMVDTAMEAAVDKLGRDVQAFEVGEILGIADWFVVASGSNRRQVRAIVENIEEWLFLEHDIKPVRIEGMQGSTSVPSREAGDVDALVWVLMDYGPVIVHVFDTAAREYYDLERLWQDVPQKAVASGER